jgi:outer membrane lipoprotein-sorting protein
VKTILFPLIAGVLATCCAHAQESAKDLANKLSALQQDGSSFVRLKMDVKSADGAKYSLQLQIKQRRSPKSSEVVYQILWPKERAGEAVLLRQTGNQAPSGSVFTLPNTVRELNASQMKEGLFGSDIAYSDVLENFFAWENQKIVGSEVVNRVNCQILESRPGKGQRASFPIVRTWVDSRRLVPMRVEKYLASSALARRIDTTDVATDDMGRSIPANMTVTSPQKGSSTEVNGSKIRHGVALTDRDFSPEE